MIKVDGKKFLFEVPGCYSNLANLVILVKNYLIVYPTDLILILTRNSAKGKNYMFPFTPENDPIKIF